MKLKMNIVKNSKQTNKCNYSKEKKKLKIITIVK